MIIRITLVYCYSDSGPDIVFSIPQLNFVVNKYVVQLRFGVGKISIAELILRQERLTD